MRNTQTVRLKSRALLLVAALIVAAGGIARAQEVAPQQVQQPAPATPGPGQQEIPGLNESLTPGEIQRLFDAYLIVEAQRFLNLTDAQYPQFLVRLKTLQDTRRRNQQQRVQLMGELQRLTNPRNAAVLRPGDDATIKERLGTLQELESRTAAEMRKAYNGLDEVLDVRQQARFRVFEEQIERRKIDLLMRARQQNRQNQPAPVRRPPPPPPSQ